MSEPTEIALVVGADGGPRCFYDEALDLRALGKLQITRASRAEPNVGSSSEPMWGRQAGLALGPLWRRGEAFAAERG